VTGGADRAGPATSGRPAPAALADGPLEPHCPLCGGEQREALFTKRGWRFVRCAGCRLVSIRPLPRAEELAAHHEQSYREGAYATFAAADQIRSMVARRRLDAVRPLAPPGPWLDVGCSTGSFVAEAIAAGLDAEGLEVSAAAVAQARARGLAVRQGAVEETEPTRTYAAVSAFDVLEHLPDPTAFVRRVAGWLAPGGVLAVTLPDIASPAARLLGRRWFYYAPPDHVHYFTPTTARRLLETGGLTDVRVKPFRKPLTLDYAAAQLAALTPFLAPPVRAAAALLPRRLRDRAWPLPLGEILLTARRATT